MNGPRACAGTPLTLKCRSTYSRAHESAATISASPPAARPSSLAVTALTRRIYAVVAAIPRGRILAYGEVAALAGRPRAPRAVGAALSTLPDELGIPWWRVVNSTGRISTSEIHHTAQVQRALLEDEGVTFTDGGHIDWDQFGWTADQDAIDQILETC